MGDCALHRPPCPSGVQVGGRPAAGVYGGLLYVGEKIKCDYAKALEWYKKAAKQGNDYSMYQIGMFYERGLGVSKDLQQARYWYKQAEENGNVIAAEAIVRIDGQ